VGIENSGGKVRNLILPDRERLTAEFRPDLLRGVVVVKGKAVSADTKTEQPFTAIPYSSWANRGKAEMTVWIPRE